MEGTNKIILAHSELDFSNRFAGTLEKCGWEVSVVKSARDIVKKIEASGINYGLIGVAIDQVNLREVTKLEEYLKLIGSKSKIFAVTAPKMSFSQVVLAKIKSLKPRDFISESYSSDEIIFRLNNVMYEKSDMRKNYRALIKTLVHCDYKQDFFDAESFTLSKDGLFIKTDKALKRDQSLFLTFQLPEDGGEFSTMGNILYQIDESTPKPRISPNGCGVYFVDLENEARESIDRYVKGSMHSY